MVRLWWIGETHPVPLHAMHLSSDDQKSDGGNAYGLFDGILWKESRWVQDKVFESSPPSTLPVGDGTNVNTSTSLSTSSVPKVICVSSTCIPPLPWERESERSVVSAVWIVQYFARAEFSFGMKCCQSWRNKCEVLLHSKCHDWRSFSSSAPGQLHC